ncbi:MAG TPA: hypothetical protein VFW94_23790 [Candidatus Acidoferrales bacterium]|nr:hypothetical protein [Candidatus Acidoferrales bacterium]
MGGGSWDSGSYHSSKATRAATGKADFEYTKTASQVHKNLDPIRINKKPFGKLEARDSDEHPNSTPVLVCFDVTGSNVERAVDAQKKLPGLMDLLNKYLKDPQVAVAANDDFKVTHRNALQISDFESDNRVDEHIRNIWLVGNGGGNDGESYDLLLYAAARKVALDSVEKRGKKGYLFMYADEPIFKYVDKNEVEAIFGDKVEADIPIAEIIEEAQRNFDIFLIWPRGGYDHAHEQYKTLFGPESVLVLQDPNMICELIASTIGLCETSATPDDVVSDLVSVGLHSTAAKALVKSIGNVAALATAPAGGTKAARI